MDKTLTIKSNFRQHSSVRRDQTVRLATIVRESRTTRLCTPVYSDNPVQTCGAVWWDNISKHASDSFTLVELSTGFLACPLDICLFQCFLWRFSYIDQVAIVIVKWLFMAIVIVKWLFMAIVIVKWLFMA
jgi:hypothetical protein